MYSGLTVPVFLTQKPMLIYIVFILLTELEVFWDWYIITRQGRNPNYVGSNILRVAVAVPLWFVCLGLRPDMSAAEFLFLPVMMGFFFWFLFDLSLNIARGLPYWYLGNKSNIDLWQKENGGAYQWFWTKFVLMAASIVIYEVMLEYLLRYI
jgi:hypothetical protein